MGWSCSDKAGQVLDKWSKACVAQTGNSNLFEVNGKKFHFEISRTEHHDGSVTGTIRKYVSFNPDTGGGMTVLGGSFKIDGITGDIIRAPKFLKEAVLTSK
jgi:hypothetical protein